MATALVVSLAAVTFAVPTLDAQVLSSSGSNVGKSILLLGMIL